MFGNVDYLAQSLNHASLMTDLSLKKVASTGDPVKLSSLNQGAGGVSFATGVMNDSSSKRNTIHSFQNAISYMQTQDEGLRQAEQIYNRMHSIASLAADPTTDDDTRSLLNDEFKILLEASSDLNGSAFNNVPLFDPRASTKQYPVDFPTNFSFNDPPDGWLDKYHGNKQYSYREKSKDVLYNSGIFTITVSPGGAKDRFILHQGDASKPIFDTGEWATSGWAKHKNWDRFIVEYGPGKDTKFKFVPLSPTNENLNKKQLSLSTLDGIENREFGDQGQVVTNPSDPTKTKLFLRTEGYTAFLVEAEWEKAESENLRVGNKSGLEVELNSIGLGLLRDDTQDDFPEISIGTLENANRAIDVIKEDLEGLSIQNGKLASNFNRVENAMETVNQASITHDKVISQLSGQHFAEEIGNLNKFRVRRSSSSSLMSRIMNLNKEMAETLI